MAFAPIEVTGSGIDFATAFVQLVSGGLNVPVPVIPGTLVKGFDPALGIGEFVFGQAVGTINQFDVVEFASTLAAGQMTTKFTQWLGTANAAHNLAVSLIALTAGQFGWFQVKGHAVVNTNGAVVIGDRGFWQANGVVSSTLVAGKQVLGMQAVTANGAVVTGYVMTNKAVYHVQRPYAQGNIT